MKIKTMSLRRMGNALPNTGEESSIASGKIHGTAFCLLCPLPNRARVLRYFPLVFLCCVATQCSGTLVPPATLGGSSDSAKSPKKEAAGKQYATECVANGVNWPTDIRECAISAYMERFRVGAERITVNECRAPSGDGPWGYYDSFDNEYAYTRNEKVAYARDTQCRTITVNEPLFEECDPLRDPLFLGCEGGSVNVTNLENPSSSQGCTAADWAADFYSVRTVPGEGSEPYLACKSADDGLDSGALRKRGHGRDLLTWTGPGCADDDCAQGVDCTLTDTETFFVFHDIRTVDNALKFKHHYHKQGSVKWLEDSGFTGSVYNCDDNFNVGSKWSRPFLDGPGDGIVQSIDGWTRADVGTCSDVPVSCAPELAYWLFPANHLNVQMEGYLYSYKGIEVSSANNNLCPPTYMSGDNRVIHSSTQFQRCRFYIGSLVWDQGVTPVSRNACPCGYWSNP